MTQHRARIAWESSGEGFAQGRYSREHTWSFDGGLVVPASPSPAIVRPPYSNPAHVDPEEALVASISSCHMLTYLHLSSKQGFVVLRYEDDAVGHLSKNSEGAWWVSTVELRPVVEYHSEQRPTPEQDAELHHRAHHECFIANSVKTAITCDATLK
jgi:organic hydroperoxide reductase OsmC/OhrA